MSQATQKKAYRGRGVSKNSIAEPSGQKSGQISVILDIMIRAASPFLKILRREVEVLLETTVEGLRDKFLHLGSKLGLTPIRRFKPLVKRAHVSKMGRSDDERVLSKISLLGGKNSSYIFPTIGSPVIRYTSHKEIPNSP